MAINDRAYNYYRRVIMEEISPKLVGTNLIAQGETPPAGSRTITSEEIQRLRGKAKIGRPGQPIPRETADITRAAIYIPEIAHGFRLHRKDREASQNFGTPYPDAGARASAQMVREAIEDMIFNGQADLGIKGIYADAGDTYEVEADAEWNQPSTTSADIVNDVVNMFAQLEANGKYGTAPKMVVSPKAYRAMFKSNIYGVSAMKEVAEFFPNKQADIYKAPLTVHGVDVETTIIPEDGGILLDFGNDIAERWIEEEVNLREKSTNEDDVTPFNVVTYQTVDIHKVDAFIALDNLIEAEA